MKFKSKFRLNRGRTFATSNSAVLNRVAMAAAATNFATPPSVIVMAAKVGREGERPGSGRQRERQERSSRSLSLGGASRPGGPPFRLPRREPLVPRLWLAGLELELEDEGEGDGRRADHRTAATVLRALVEPGPGRAWRTGRLRRHS